MTVTDPGFWLGRGGLNRVRCVKRGGGLLSEVHSDDFKRRGLDPQEQCHESFKIRNGKVLVKQQPSYQTIHHDYGHSSCMDPTLLEKNRT